MLKRFVAATAAFLVLGLPGATLATPIQIDFVATGFQTIPFGSAPRPDAPTDPVEGFVRFHPLDPLPGFGGPERSVYLRPIAAGVTIDGRSYDASNTLVRLGYDISAGGNTPRWTFCSNNAGECGVGPGADNFFLGLQGELNNPDIRTLDFREVTYSSARFDAQVFRSQTGDADISVVALPAALPLFLSMLAALWVVPRWRPRSL